MTNYYTDGDAIFGGAWWNRMITKQQDCHSTTPADKQTNKDTPNCPQLKKKDKEIDTEDLKTIILLFLFKYSWSSSTTMDIHID